MPTHPNIYSMNGWWNRSIEADGSRRVHTGTAILWFHTQGVFPICAQCPVLQRLTLPPQPLNKPAQQRRLFRIRSELSCGQIAYLINVVMEISKKTYDCTLVRSTLALILFSLVFPFSFLFAWGSQLYAFFFSSRFIFSVLWSSIGVYTLYIPQSIVLSALWLSVNPDSWKWGWTKYEERIKVNHKLQPPNQHLSQTDGYNHHEGKIYYRAVVLHHISLILAYLIIW